MSSSRTCQSVPGPVPPAGLDGMLTTVEIRTRQITRGLVVLCVPATAVCLAAATDWQVTLLPVAFLLGWLNLAGY